MEKLQNKKKMLLTEYRMWNTKDIITESSSEGYQKVFLKGKMQEKEALNQNERFYPSWILEREVEEYKKLIPLGRTAGELDHPEGSIVSFQHVSHAVRELWWEGNILMGKIEIFGGPDPYGTDDGRKLEALVRRGMAIGISSRGVGSTIEDDEGREIVQPDYQLICWDVVSNPSTHNAFLVKEGVSKSSRSLMKEEIEKYRFHRTSQVLNRILKG